MPVRGAAVKRDSRRRGARLAGWRGTGWVRWVRRSGSGRQRPQSEAHRAGGIVSGSAWRAWLSRAREHHDDLAV